MKKFIYKQLDQQYEISTSSVGNDGIYLISTRGDIFRTPEYGNNIVKDIVTVFNVKEEEAKIHIHKWSVTKKHGVDLTFYWENNYKGYNLESINFPNVQRVFSQTLAQDLVSVQPMAMPTGHSFYLDYKYEKKTWYNQNVFYIFVKNIFKKKNKRRYGILEHDSKTEWLNQFKELHRIK